MRQLHLLGQGNAYATAIYERLNGGADQASAPLAVARGTRFRAAALA